MPPNKISHFNLNKFPAKTKKSKTFAKNKILQKNIQTSIANILYVHLPLKTIFNTQKSKTILHV